MKKKLYYFGVIWGVVIITAFLIFTACQNSNKTSEPEICTSCYGYKTFTCRSCLGKGRGLCSFCDGSKACNFCEDGYKYHREKCSFSFCTSGVIVNPYTGATYDCPKCDHGFAKVAEKCVFCDGTKECSHCDGTGLAENCTFVIECECKEVAGLCKDCQGRGEIDCTYCE